MNDKNYFDLLRQRIDKHFDEINQRLNSIDQKLEKVKKQVDDIKTVKISEEDIKSFPK